MRNLNSTNPRPTNSQLVWIGILQFVLIAILGAWFWPLIYVIFTGQRETVETALISAGISVLVYVPLYFKHGIAQRKQFIANGGDPKGMNLWMFGAMGFDWRNPEGRF